MQVIEKTLVLLMDPPMVSFLINQMKNWWKKHMGWLPEKNDSLRKHYL